MLSSLNGLHTPSEIALGEFPLCVICKVQRAHPLYGGGTRCEDCDVQCNIHDAPAICYRANPKVLRVIGDNE